MRRMKHAKVIFSMISTGGIMNNVLKLKHAVDVEKHEKTINQGLHF